MITLVVLTNLMGHATDNPWSGPRQLKQKPFLRANPASGEQIPRVFGSSAQVWAAKSCLLLCPSDCVEPELPCHLMKNESIAGNTIIQKAQVNLAPLKFCRSSSLKPDECPQATST